MSKPQSFKEEWARYWHIPLTSALGYSASGLQLFGLGSFVNPIQHEFGWSRAQITSGAAIVSIGVALASLPMGVLLDRFGARRVGLVGVLMMATAVALLSTATGTISNWLLLWAVIAMSAAWVQAPVWTSAVVSHFDRARGLALGVTLCGTSFAVFAMPLLATWLVGAFGWRYAFVGLGGIWAAVSLPILYLFFHSAQDGTGEARARLKTDREMLPGVSLAESLRTLALYKLLFANTFFAFAIVGIIVHFVPLLTDRGAAPMTAAAAASLIGIFSVVGTLGAGAMLDRFPGRIIGTIAFLLPIPGCALLLIDGVGFAGYSIAAALFGLTLGADVDVITYLATRHFGLKNFGAIQGVLLGAVAIGAALGPLAAGAAFDHFGSYAPFLLGISGLMLTSAILMASLKGMPQPDTRSSAAEPT